MVRQYCLKHIDMEKTRIIMTEVKCPSGKYVRFASKSSGNTVATVDRIEGKYTVFTYNEYGHFSERGSRSSKQSAIKLAQEWVSRLIEDAEFKWNVVAERYR